MRHYILLFSFFFFLSSLSAQTQLIRGRVLSGETGKPIANAEIKIKESGAGTTTNNEGAFSLQIDPATLVTLLVSHVAYLPQSKILNFSNESKNILFRLKPYVMESQPIVITDTRATRHETPVTFSNKSAEEIKNSYAASDVPILKRVMRLATPL
jgi:carboxypeptidase-like protein